MTIKERIHSCLTNNFASKEHLIFKVQKYAAIEDKAKLTDKQIEQAIEEELKAKKIEYIQTTQILKTNKIKTQELPMMLDYKKNIFLNKQNSPLPNYQLLRTLYEGLSMLYQNVRYYENNQDHGLVFSMSVVDKKAPHPIFVHWFANTATNFLGIVALFDIMNKNDWTSKDIPTNSKEITKYCKQYVEDFIPQILTWRNKVGAHVSASYPRKDNIATIEHSLMSGASYTKPHFQATIGVLKTKGCSSEIPQWILTKEYEKIAKRCFPNQQLIPLKKEKEPEKPKV